MASGINNTFRLAGVAIGVAALGALLQNRIEHAFSLAEGSSDASNALGAAISSSGLRAVAGHPDLVEPAKSAFVTGLDDILVTGAVLLVIGAVAALTLLRTPAPAAAPSAETA